MLDHNGKRSQHIPGSGMKQVYRDDKYEVFVSRFPEDAGGEYVVRDLETGMEYWTDSYDEVQEFDVLRADFGFSRKEQQGYSEEQKATRQREILERFEDRVTEFMLRATPHERDLAERAMTALTDVVRRFESDGLLPKEVLKKLKRIYNEMDA